MTSICSINKLVIAKLPNSFKDYDDDILGKRAEEIFSTKALIECLERNRKELDVKEQFNISDLCQILTDKLNDANPQTQDLAKSIIKKFGYRLGLIFLTLKLGEKENRVARTNWNSQMWEYWANVSNVILVGGLTSGIFGEYFYKYILEVFKIANVKPYNFILYENSSTIGLMGCATKLDNHDNELSLVLDMGHTSIKRSLVRTSNNEILGTIPIPTLPSKHTNNHDINEEERIANAIKLHKYIKSTIISSYNNGKELGKMSDEIVISIANYVADGKLNPKAGGFSKLAMLSDNYGETLSEEISGLLKKKISIKLIHDATAVAYYFHDYKDSVCVTAGTAFGVSFPTAIK